MFTAAIPVLAVVKIASKDMSAHIDGVDEHMLWVIRAQENQTHVSSHTFRTLAQFELPNALLKKKGLSGA
jgi:hypothetical protein